MKTRPKADESTFKINTTQNNNEIIFKEEFFPIILLISCNEICFLTNFRLDDLDICAFNLLSAVWLSFCRRRFEAASAFPDTNMHTESNLLALFGYFRPLKTEKVLKEFKEPTAVC